MHAGQADSPPLDCLQRTRPNGPLEARGNGGVHRGSGGVLRVTQDDHGGVMVGDDGFRGVLSPAGLGLAGLRGAG